MKHFIAILVLAALAPFGIAGEKIDKAQAGNIKAYNLFEFRAHQNELVGSVIKLKFNWRGESVREDSREPGNSISSLETNVQSSSLKTGSGYTSLEVSIPKEGMAWFGKLSTRTDSRMSYIVFAKVTKDPEHGMVVELVGRELKTDFKDSRVIW